MPYQEIKTENPNLLNFIKCFWYSATTKNVEHTILPNGYIDLIISPNNTKITGIWTKPINVQYEENTFVFGVRFKLLIAEIFTDIDFKSILNSHQILPTDYFKNEKINLENLELFSSQMEEIILELANNQKTIQENKIRLFQEIFKKETFSVSEISQKTFWTSRQINRYFNTRFGTSLKTYLNIIRCNSSYRNIANKTINTPVEYFDKSHFIKEIKAFTTHSPKELYENKNDRFLQLTTLKEN